MSKKFLLQTLISLLILIFSIICKKLPNFKIKYIPYDSNKYSGWAKEVEFVNTDMISEFSQFVTFFNSFKMHSWCIVAPPKGKESIGRKIRTEVVPTTGTDDLELITDFARASFVVRSVDDIWNVRNELVKYFGNPVKEKDSFTSPYESGYRDYKLIFESKNYYLKRNMNCLKIKI
jgi:hypothetical protein